LTGFNETFTQFAIPEPATHLLMGGALLALGWFGRSRRRR
jgi:hypothetical protein